MENLNYHPVVCFGEVLWDILPSSAVPGGAPMNVAYHLHKLNKNPALITSVGMDERGDELIDFFSKQGVCSIFFQRNPDHETGKVYAEPNEYNEVVYDIVTPVAWDFIEWNENLNDLVSNAKYFVYGSLASRNKVSRDTLYQLLETGKTKVLDINLRPPHFHRNHIEFLLHKADIVKMNIAELELVTGWFTHFKDTIDRMKIMRDQFNIDTLIITMGGNGAIVNDKGTIYKHPGYKVHVADTIGSGDAFLAGFLAQLLKGAPVENAIDFASALGALVATLPGGCPHYEISEITNLMTLDQNKIIQKNI